MKAKSAWTDEQQKAFRDSVGTGLSTKHLARLFGCTPRAIRTKAAVVGVKIGNQRKWSGEEINQLFKLAEKGLPIGVICTSFSDRSYQSVLQAVYRRGVPRAIPIRTRSRARPEGQRLSVRG